MKKVIVITGASAGIGKAAAQLMAKNGHTVYAAARRLDKMKDLEQYGVHLLEMDVTDDEAMARGVNTIIETEKRINVLVNNAGYGSYGALEDVPLSEARYQFEVNVFGLARLTQLVLPHMRAQKSGRIINISSMGGRFGEPHGAWYHATKFAVEGLSDSLRMELKQFGIDIVVIQPGAIKTEWGGIAAEHLLKTSGSTAYGNLARLHAKVLKNEDGKMGSDPIVIAKTIQKAIEANKPKTRYAAGALAKSTLFWRAVLPDRIFDSVLMRMLK